MKQQQEAPEEEVEEDADSDREMATEPTDVHENGPDDDKSQKKSAHEEHKDVENVKEPEASQMVLGCIGVPNGLPIDIVIIIEGLTEVQEVGHVTIICRSIL